MKSIYPFKPILTLFLSVLFLSKASAQTPELIFPATHYAGSVAISPDEKWVVSVQANEVKIWENATTRLIKNINFSKNVDGPVNETGILAISPNSKIVALQNADTLYFFNLDKFDFDRKIKINQSAQEMVFAADSKTLYCGGHFTDKFDDFFLQKINVADGSNSIFQKYSIKTPASHEINRMSLSPDGNFLLIYDAVMGSRLYDLTANKLVKTFEKGAFPYTFLSNGNFIAYSGEKEKAFFVEELDGKTYKSLRKSVKIFEGINDVSAQNYAVSYPSVSSSLVIEYQGEFVVFDTQKFTFSEKNKFALPALGMNNAQNICLSPSGKYYIHGLMMSRYDLNNNELDKRFGILPVHPDVHFPLQHTDGVWMAERVLTFKNGGFKMRRFPKPCPDCAFTVRLTKDGSKGFVIGSDAGLYQFDPNAQEINYEKISAITDDNLEGLRLFESLGLMTVVGKETVYVLDLKTLKLRNQIPKPESGGSHALLERGLNYYTDISPDKTKLLWNAGSEGDNDWVYCFDLTDKHLLWQYKGKWTANARFADNGKKVQLTSLYDLVELETATGKMVGTKTVLSPSKWEWWTTVSPSSKVAATQMPTAKDDGVGADIDIFDISTKKRRGVLRGSDLRTEGLTFIRNERYLVAEEYGGLRLWDIEKQREIAKILMFQDSDDWLILTPDGRFDASPEAMKKMYFTRGKEVIPLESLYEKFYVPNLLSQIWDADLPKNSSSDINKLKTPPSVKITYEPSKIVKDLLLEGQILETSTDKPTIQITIEANAMGDIVDEMRLFHNGKLIVNKTRNLIVEDEKTGADKKVFTIDLVEGENTLKAVAINSQRTESKPDAIIVTYKPSKTSNARPTVANDINLYLVVIGINKYKNPKYNLNYATADATSFKEAIEKGGTSIFGKTNIIFIGDDKATKTGISTELDKIKATATAKDVFIFYYAGHGVLNQNKEFFLVPYDVTQLYGNDDALAQKGLSANQLQQFSKDIKAQKQLFILDACQSAGALDQVMASRGAAEEKAIAQLARATGTHWLTASGSEQFASEFQQLGHGTFTYVLLEALSGKADKGGDKKITVKELDAYLQEVVPEVTAKYRGTPQYPASYGFGNDFPIGVVKS